MSDYVFVPSVGWMFGASLLCMCVAGIGATVGLAAIRLLDNVLLRVALGLAVVSSLLAALFRTDLGESLSTSAQIHRYAAGVVFFCVPIAAFLVARGLTGVGYLARDRKLLHANVIVTSVVLVLFMTSHFGAMPEVLRELNGLFQRILFVVELALLAQLTLLPLRFRALPAAR
jgi:predicted membrane channel-forming protein YqfA (hemolysin III family)